MNTKRQKAYEIILEKINKFLTHNKYKKIYLEFITVDFKIETFNIFENKLKKSCEISFSKFDKIFMFL